MSCEEHQGNETNYFIIHYSLRSLRKNRIMEKRYATVPLKQH